MKNESLNETIGGRIKLRRRSLGKTLAELGRQIGVSAAAISLWENGSTKPDTKRLEALSKSLYCSVEWLVDGTIQEPKPLTPEERVKMVQEAIIEYQPSSSPDLEEISNIYVVLPLEQRKKLISYAYELLEEYQNELAEKINIVKSISNTTRRD